MFSWRNEKNIYLGPFVQSIISLMRLLVVKMVTVLISLANAKATHIFSAKILGYMPYFYQYVF